MDELSKVLLDSLKDELIRIATEEGAKALNSLFDMIRNAGNEPWTQEKEIAFNRHLHKAIRELRKAQKGEGGEGGE